MYSENSISDVLTIPKEIIDNLKVFYEG